MMTAVAKGVIAVTLLMAAVFGREATQLPQPVPTAIPADTSNYEEVVQEQVDALPQNSETAVDLQNKLTSYESDENYLEYRKQDREDIQESLDDCNDCDTDVDSDDPEDVDDPDDE